MSSNHQQTVVSVVITLFNKAKYLERVIASYKKQPISVPVEFIFVDDASTDNTLDTLRQHGTALPGLQIIENTNNQGPAIRVNQGVEAASGRFVLLLDGDDIIADNAINTMYQLIKTHDADIVTSTYGGNLESTDISIPAIPKNPDYDVIEPVLPFIIKKRQTGMGLMVRRDTFIKSGGCDEKVFVQDISLYLSLSLNAKRLIRLKEKVHYGFWENTTTLSREFPTQELYDRTLSYQRFLLNNKNQLSSLQKLRVAKVCYSTAWKYKKRRDNIKFWPKSPFFWLYLLASLPTPLSWQPAFLSKTTQAFDSEQERLRIVR